MARTERVPEVDDRTASALRALWRRAADVDGVEAVSEAFRLAVGPPRDGVVHLLRWAGDGTLVGYAQVAAAGTTDAVAELVVDPPHRRRGHGRALLDPVLDEGARSVWAHGMLPAADALARSAASSRADQPNSALQIAPPNITPTGTTITITTAKMIAPAIGDDGISDGVIERPSWQKPATRRGGRLRPG